MQTKPNEFYLFCKAWFKLNHKLRHVAHGVLWFGLILFLALATVSYFRTRSQLSDSIRAEGVITRFMVKDHQSYAVVTFTDRNGQTQTRTAEFSNTMSRQEQKDLLDTTITILYQEDKSSFVEYTFYSTWFFPMFFTFLAVFMLLPILFLPYIVSKIEAIVIKAISPNIDGESLE